MQRTRRIQITRYRRRVTVTQGEPTAVEIAEEGLEEDSIFQVLQSIPAMSEGIDPKDMVLKDVESEDLPRRRSLLSLGNLLRPRKRT